MTLPLIDELAMALGSGKRDLLHIIATAPKRYKVFPIQKRRGGTRTIAQPSRELKAVQRALASYLLSDLPVHTAATGYVKGINIADNAARHLQSRAILKLDFKDFFPSIRVEDWELYAKKMIVDLTDDDIRLCSSILFWSATKGSTVPRCLSIGAPTSPLMSNLIMFEIDAKLSEAAKALKIIYTRYADDITASGATMEALKAFENSARTIIRQTRSPRLQFNDEKRGMYTTRQRRMVTGLILTPDKKVSIGRERKRQISAMLHKSTVDALGQDGIAKLKGLLGFCLSAEPSFVSRLREKYGNGAVNKVLQYEIPRLDRSSLKKR